MIGAEPADMIDGRVHVGNDLYGHDRVEELPAPIVRGGCGHIRVDGLHGLVSPDLDTRLVVASDEIG